MTRAEFRQTLHNLAMDRVNGILNAAEPLFKEIDLLKEILSERDKLSKEIAEQTLLILKEKDEEIESLKATYKTTPHKFKGRRDRWCELCDEPDRAEVHKVT